MPAFFVPLLSTTTILFLVNLDIKRMSFLPPFLLLLLSLARLSHSAFRLPELYGSFRMRSGTPTNKDNSGSSSGFDPSRVTQLSWHPRAFLYKGFLSDEECDHLIKLARSKLKKSMVADNVSGKSIQSQVRTSSGYFLKKGQDSVVRRIENRISSWTFLPKENGESMHILHYGPGQKYEPHFDYFNDKYNIVLGGHRMATVLMYLSDVKLGGETVFPSVQPSAHNEEGSLSKCGKSGFAVKPKKGDALLFFSLHLNASTDTASLHRSCPVIEGEKWAATCWIHVRRYNQ